jgi:hypothetical protein
MSTLPTATHKGWLFAGDIDGAVAYGQTPSPSVTTDLCLVGAIRHRCCIMLVGVLAI